MRLPGSMIEGVLAALLLLQQSSSAGDQRTQVSAAERLGSISGVILFKGDTPKSPVPDDAGMTRDLIEVDRATRGLRDVVVSVTPISAATAAQPQPKLRERAVQMDQRDHAFVPKVIAVMEGEPVVFMNSDPANHNVRTASPLRSNEFNIYIGEGNKYEHRFAAQPRPIRVGCDIHPWMRGWVYVFDHSKFSVTGERGEFHIGPLRAGEYNLRIEQPDIRFKREQKIRITPGETTPVRIEAKSGSLEAKE